MFTCDECGHEYEDALDSCPECDATRDDVKRPALVAVAAITAEFQTQQGSSKLSSEVGELWPPNDAVCFGLITEIERKFKRKNKYHSYYENDATPSSVPSRLQLYIKGNIKFKALVALFMKDLVDAAIKAGAYKVAGGNIVFMHYKNLEDDDVGRLLAIMVDKKNGFDFDENLIPKNSEQINIDALRQAALFDLTLFDATYPSQPSGETYLRFIKGASRGSFFKSAFGCEIKADNGRSIEQLHGAIDKYQEHFKLPLSFYDKAKQKVDELLEKAAKDHQEISARKLFEAVESLIPEGRNLRGTFEKFVNEHEYEINDHIEPTRNNANFGQWVEVTANDESFNAKIYRSKLGAVGSDTSVQYDVENHQLILKVTDPATREALTKNVKAHES
tara:strand:- start:2215 stop:3384 length:1170 start_codon:yes stop_codon:yes gene_type:complete